MFFSIKGPLKSYIQNNCNKLLQKRCTTVYHCQNLFYDTFNGLICNEIYKIKNLLLYFKYHITVIGLTKTNWVMLEIQFLRSEIYYYIFILKLTIKKLKKYTNSMFSKELWDLF